MLQAALLCGVASILGEADGDKEGDGGRLDRAAAAWGAVAEVEILGQYDLGNSAAHQRRVCRPCLVRKLAIPKSRGSFAANGEAAAWHYLVDKLRQLHGLTADAVGGRAAHIVGLVQRLRRLRWPFKADAPPLWRWRCQLRDAVGGMCGLPYAGGEES